MQGGIIGEHIAADAIGAREIRANSIYLRAGNITGRLEAYQINATYLQVNAANVTGKLTAAQIETDELTVSSGNIKGILQAIQLTEDVKNVVRFRTFTGTFYDSYAGFSHPGFNMVADRIDTWFVLLRRSTALSPRIKDYEYIQLGVREWRAGGFKQGSSFPPSQGTYVDSLVTFRANRIKSGGGSSQDPRSIVLGYYRDEQDPGGFSRSIFTHEPVVYHAVLYTSGGNDVLEVQRQTAFAGDKLHWICGIQDVTGIKGLDVCLLYTSPSPRDRQKSRMPSSA